MRHIVLIDPDRPRAIVWTRDAANAWMDREIDGLDGAVDLSAIGVVLAMAEIFAEVSFDDA